MKPRIPPPFIFLCAIITNYAVSRLNPIEALKFTPNNLTALIFFVAAVPFMLWAIIAFKKARTTVNPLQPEKVSSLVVSGPFRISRNPMYLAMIFILFASFMKFGEMLGLAIFLIVLIYMDQVQIKAEENAMRQNFGQAFEDYCQSVRRWI